MDSILHDLPMPPERAMFEAPTHPLAEDLSAALTAATSGSGCDAAGVATAGGAGVGPVAGEHRSAGRPFELGHTGQW